MLTQRLMGMRNVDVTKMRQRRNRKRKDKEVNMIRKCAVHVACQSSFRDVGDMASGVTQV